MIMSLLFYPSKLGGLLAAIGPLHLFILDTGFSLGLFAVVVDVTAFLHSSFQRGQRASFIFTVNGMFIVVLVKKNPLQQ